MAAAQPPGTGEYVGSPADADDALVRRLVDAAVLPDLLARELAATLLEAVTADVTVVFVELPGGDVRLIAHAGADADGARTIARLAIQGGTYGAGALIVEPIGREPDGPRYVADRHGAAAGPSAAAPRPHDGGGGAPGFRSLRRARSADRRRSTPRPNVRSSRCCPDSSAPAPP